MIVYLKQFNAMSRLVQPKTLANHQETFRYQLNSSSINFYNRCIIPPIQIINKINFQYSLSSSIKATNSGNLLKQTVQINMLNKLKRIWMRISKRNESQPFELQKMQLTQATQIFNIQKESTKDLIKIYDLITKINRSKDLQPQITILQAKIRQRLLTQLQQIPQEIFNLTQLMTLYRISTFSNEQYLRLIVINLIIKALKDQNIEINNIEHFFTSITKIDILQFTQKYIRSQFLSLIVANKQLIPIQNLLNICIQLNNIDHYDMTAQDVLNVEQFFLHLCNQKHRLTRSMMYQLFESKIIYWNKTNLFQLYQEILQQLCQDQSFLRQKKMNSLDLIKLLGLYSLKAHTKNSNKISSLKAFISIQNFIRENEKNHRIIGQSQRYIAMIVQAQLLQQSQRIKLAQEWFRINNRIGIELLFTFANSFINNQHIANLIMNYLLSINPKDLSTLDLIKLFLIISHIKYHSLHVYHQENNMLQQKIKQQCLLIFKNSQEKRKIQTINAHQWAKKFLSKSLFRFVLKMKVELQKIKIEDSNDYKKVLVQLSLISDINWDFIYGEKIDVNSESLTIVQYWIKRHLQLLRQDPKHIGSQINKLCMNFFHDFVKKSNEEVIQNILDILIISCKYRGPRRINHTFAIIIIIIIDLRKILKYYDFLKVRKVNKKLNSLIKIVLNIDSTFQSTQLSYKELLKNDLLPLLKVLSPQSTIFYTIVKHALRLSLIDKVHLEYIPDNYKYLNILEQQKIKCLKNDELSYQINQDTFGFIILNNLYIKNNLINQDNMNIVLEIIEKSPKKQICEYINNFQLQSEIIILHLFKAVFQEPQLLEKIDIIRIINMANECKWYNFLYSFFGKKDVIQAYTKTHLKILSMRFHQVILRSLLRYSKLQEEIYVYIQQLRQYCFRFNLKMLQQLSFSRYQFNQDQMKMIKQAMLTLNNSYNDAKYYPSEILNIYFNLEDYMQKEYQGAVIYYLKNVHQIKFYHIYAFYIHLKYPDFKIQKLEDLIQQNYFNFSRINAEETSLINNISLKIQNKIIRKNSKFLHKSNRIFQIKDAIILFPIDYLYRKRIFLEKYLKLIFGDKLKFIWIQQEHKKNQRDILNQLRKHIDFSEDLITQRSQEISPIRREHHRHIRTTKMQQTISKDQPSTISMLQRQRNKTFFDSSKPTSRETIKDNRQHIDFSEYLITQRSQEISHIRREHRRHIRKTKMQQTISKDQPSTISMLQRQRNKTFFDSSKPTSRETIKDNRQHIVRNSRGKYFAKSNSKGNKNNL